MNFLRKTPLLLALCLVTAQAFYPKLVAQTDTPKDTGEENVEPKEKESWQQIADVFDKFIEDKGKTLPPKITDFKRKIRKNVDAINDKIKQRYDNTWDGLLAENTIGMDLATFAKKFQNHKLQLLDKEANALTSKQKSSLLGAPVNEAILRFEDKAFASATLMIYNRGDDGVVELSVFEEKITELLSLLSTNLNAPAQKKAAHASAVKLRRWAWQIAHTELLFEASSLEGRAEFMRLRVKAAGENLKFTRSKSRKVLTENLRRESNGDVFLGDIPMVDQGQKGYCVAASMERLFRYFGLPVDQHEFAQLTNASPKTGASVEDLAAAVRSLRGKFGIRVKELIERDAKWLGKFVRNYNLYARRKNEEQLDLESAFKNPNYIFTKTNPDLLLLTQSQGTGKSRFFHAIEYHIQKGYPLLWGVYLGVFDKKDSVGASNEQSGGGHMRLIIGFNKRGANGEPTVIYSDSWGAGHEKKYMPLAKAYTITTNLFEISPTR